MLKKTVFGMQGDYLLPNITVPVEEEKKPIGL